MAQTVKCLPTMRETRVQSLGWEDLLEKEMVTLSSILAWKSHGRRSLGEKNPIVGEAAGHGVAKSRTRMSNFTSL